MSLDSPEMLAPLTDKQPIKGNMPSSTLFLHESGCECHECRELDRPLAWQRREDGSYYCDYTLRDLIFRTIYAELQDNSILHLFIRRNLVQQIKNNDELRRLLCSLVKD